MLLAPLASMRLFRRARLIVARYRDLIGSVLNPYRPELYYMRGPGPKWRAKHRRAPVRSANARAIATRRADPNLPATPFR
jgi:hypothetical protein